MGRVVEFTDVVKESVDELYKYYETEHSWKTATSLRPSEPWREDPGTLLTKDEFIGTLVEDNPMKVALDVLIFSKSLPKKTE